MKLDGREAEVLGKLLVLQSFAASLPDKASVSELLKEGLAELPGVTDVRITSPGEMAPAGWREFNLKMDETVFGAICLKINNEEAFHPFDPLVGNLALILAVRKEKQKTEAAHKTRRRQLEDEVKRRVAAHKKVELEFNRFLETIPDIFFRTDRNGVITLVSPGVSKVLGFEVDECIGMQVAEFLFDSSERVENTRLIREAKGKAVRVEGMIRHKDGGEVWASAHARALLDADGEIIGVEGIVRDLSDHKQTELDLRRAIDEAERANLAKSEFLASMSHELRTPLNAVLGFAQILQSDSTNPLTEKQLKHIEYILEGGNHLLELVNQVLDLARVEADQLQLSFDDVNVSEVVADCIALTIPLGKPRGITITNELDGGQPQHVRADKLRLKQVLFNLLSNAVKYNNEGGNVTITGREIDNRFLRIFVTDTGPGIAEKNHARIFRMFDRLDIPSTQATDGAGVGLSVTKLLVEKMAGQIGFESEEGVGSTFWIELPLVSNDQVVFWDDTLRIGVDVIDKDHQIIASLLNKVSHGSVGGVDLDQVINELVEYIGYHFAREEAIMEVCGYPDIKTHREKHQILAAQVQDLAETLHKRDDPEMSQRLRALLQGWWTDHIMKVDTELADYTQGKAQDIRKALQSID